MRMPLFHPFYYMVVAMAMFGLPTAVLALEKDAFYVGVDASHVWFRNFGDDTPAYRMQAGFRPSRYFALEIGQVAFFDMRNRFNNDAGDIVDMRIKDGGIFGLSVVGIYPLRKRWSLHGRLGLSMWSVFYELESSAFPGVITNRKDDDLSVSLGLGLTYDLNSLLAVRAGVDYYVYQPSIPPYDDGQETIPAAALGILIRPFH